MIALQDIHVRFQNKVLFEGLDIHISKGEKVVLSGRSGMGKSSIFSLIQGFIKPTHGWILFDGEVQDSDNIWHMRRKMAYVDQAVSLPSCVVSDWFKEVRSYHANRDSCLDFSNLKSLLHVLQLPEKISLATIAGLSGGERQRLALVMAVSLDRKVFLLDEPTASLDKDLKQAVAEFFLSREEWTVVVSSHDDVWGQHSTVKIFDLERGQWHAGS